MIPKLSILIPALAERRSMLSDLLNSLYEQREMCGAYVEILVRENVGPEEPQGTTMNRLMDMARGEYLCFIEDDDQVCGCYLESILAALASNPDVVTFDALRTDLAEVWRFRVDSRNGTRPIAGLPNGVEMTANHFCVWNTKIARSIRWPDMSWRQSIERNGKGVDQVWYDNVIRTHPGMREVSIERILYLYRYHPKTTRAQA